MLLLMRETQRKNVENDLFCPGGEISGRNLREISPDEGRTFPGEMAEGRNFCGSLQPVLSMRSGLFLSVHFSTEREANVMCRWLVRNVHEKNCYVGKNSFIACVYDAYIFMGIVVLS